MEMDLFRAMNTDFTVGVEGSDPDRAFMLSKARVAEAEQRFSRFLPNSELSRLNRSGGDWFNASEPLFNLVTLAIKLSKLTGGLYNPSILPALHAMGYSQTFENIDPHTPNPHAPALTHDLTLIERDAQQNRLRMPPQMQIDLGGIAKGWIAEQIANQLKSTYECGVVNAGGDMFLFGNPSDGSDWQIAVQNPFDLDHDILDLVVAPGGVATSSTKKRVWIQNGAQRHHIIDPRTGLSADTEWASATALAPSGALAEVLAKAALIGGESWTLQMTTDQPECSILAVTQDQKCTFYSEGNKYELK